MSNVAWIRQMKYNKLHTSQEPWLTPAKAPPYFTKAKGKLQLLSVTLCYIILSSLKCTSRLVTITNKHKQSRRTNIKQWFTKWYVKFQGFVTNDLKNNKEKKVMLDILTWIMKRSEIRPKKFKLGSAKSRSKFLSKQHSLL